MNKVAIYGTGKTAEIVHQYLKNEYEVVAFLENNSTIKNKHNIPVVDDYTFDKRIPIFVAIGVNKLNTLRQNVYLRLKREGYKFISYIHPRATVASTVTIGENCIVMEENVIQDYVTIGDNNILWSGNHIGHHTNIGDHNFISSHVVISGNCKIGNNNFFGVNSCIGDEVSVGNYNWFSPLTSSVKDIGDEQLLVLPKEARPVVAKSSTKRYFKVEMD